MPWLRQPSAKHASRFHGQWAAVSKGRPNTIHTEHRFVSFIREIAEHRRSSHRSWYRRHRPTTIMESNAARAKQNHIFHQIVIEHQCVFIL